MDDKIFDQIYDVDLKKTMESSYIDYAMSVIASRALPDVRDGLKPVQRRVLYSMIELNNGPDKPHRKCARIVGDTMGKYHPHGDSSILRSSGKYGPALVYQISPCGRSRKLRFHGRRRRGGHAIYGGTPQQDFHGNDGGYQQGYC